MAQGVYPISYNFKSEDRLQPALHRVTKPLREKLQSLRTKEREYKVWSNSVAKNESGIPKGECRHGELHILCIYSSQIFA